MMPEDMDDCAGLSREPDPEDTALTAHVLGYPHGSKLGSVDTELDPDDDDDTPDWDEDDDWDSDDNLFDDDPDSDYDEDDDWDSDDEL